jgi:6,7-dimethyl-8-ribityllumazine synthase
MKLLIVLADFYADISAMQLAGASDYLNERKIAFDVVTVPGALEIPPAIAFAAQAVIYDGYIALGCVIRGETTHYDTVCNDSSRGLMELGIQHYLPIGNGILTVENREQALVRADKTQKNKGAGAAEACVRLVELQQRWLDAE